MLYFCGKAKILRNLFCQPLWLGLWLLARLSPMESALYHFCICQIYLVEKLRIYNWNCALSMHKSLGESYNKTFETIVSKLYIKDPKSELRSIANFWPAMPLIFPFELIRSPPLFNLIWTSSFSEFNLTSLSFAGSGMTASKNKLFNWS